MSYEENVYAPGSLMFAVAAVTLATVGAGLWIFIGEDRLIASVVLILVAGLIAAALSVFLVLRIHADEDRLRARFGPWGLDLSTDLIERASVARYPWLAYGGWGMRWGSHDGRWGRALSVPPMRSGVFVDTTEGKRHYLNSRSPEALARALNLLAGTVDAG